jgi:hypothetical protein
MFEEDDFSGAYCPRGEHGDHGGGVEEGNSEGEDYDEGELAEYLSRLTLDEEEGQEDDHNGESRGDNGLHDFRSAGNGRINGRFLIPLDMAEDVFEDNDCVVYDEARGEGKATQRDGVEGETAEIHQCESRCD